MKPTGIGFEKRCSDNSGVEYGVYLDGGNSISFKGPGMPSVDFPVEELSWLIEALTTIQTALEAK